MISPIGENASREWDADPFGPELWDAMELAEADPEAALCSIRKLAEEGSSLSMRVMGDIYLFGRWGLPEDTDLAELWLRRSAEAGSIDGAFLLARHLNGLANYKEALEQYRELADRGYSPAMFALACAYKNGEGVERDLQKSMEYFRMADRAGHLHSGLWLAWLWRNENLGFAMKVRGYLKSFRMIIPFVNCNIRYPKSDRLRL